MADLRLRLTANSDETNAVVNQLAGVEGVDSVEEIADLMPHMDDPDSSSAGLSDVTTAGTHLVLVRAANQDSARRALESAKEQARQLGIALEVESEDA